MTDSHHKLRSFLLAVLVVTATFATAGVGGIAMAAGNQAGNDDGSAGNTDDGTVGNSDDGSVGNTDGDASPTFYVIQGQQCYEVKALGNGDTSVGDFYDYRPTASGGYASHGTVHLQDNQESKLFVYNGTDGYSLVFLQDKYAESDSDAPYGGTATFNFTGMPEDGSWAVRDDSYDNPDDNWDTSGSEQGVDWMWSDGRNDGGAFRGIVGANITITPKFNQDATAWGDWAFSGDSNNRTMAWKLIRANGSEESLDMSGNVTITTEGCSVSGGEDTTAPNADVSASPNPVGNNKQVTLDASNSTDDGGSGIAEYKWDFNGDGQVDETTESPTVTHTYSSPDTYEASVTVVDGNGNAADATVSVTVREPDTQAPTAAISISPKTADRDQLVSLDASNSTDNRNIAAYEWDLDDDGEYEYSGDVVKQRYSEAGTYNVSVKVIDDAGNADVANATVTVTNDTAPYVQSYVVEGGEDKTVEVSFTASKTLTNVTVEITDENGTVVATLNESDFTTSDFTTSDAGDYVDYSAETTVESNGTYYATLVEAVDDNGDDAADGQTDDAYVGPVNGDITYVDGDTVRVNGTFEAVEVSVSFYGQSGIGTSFKVLENVSGTTVIDANESGVNGSMITLVSAIKDTSTTDAEPDLRKEHPRSDYYAEAIQPRPVSVSLKNVNKVGDGTYEVTFGYQNPNDETLDMDESMFSGNVSEVPPRKVEPGNHTFTVTWTPDSQKNYLKWTLNQTNFGQGTAHAATPPARLLDGGETDSNAPNASVSVPAEVPMDETFVIDASDSYDDNGIVWYKYYVDGDLLWAGNPNHTPDMTEVHPWSQKEFPNGADAYKITVKVWDNEGQSDKAHDWVTLKKTDDGDGSDGDGSDGDSDDGDDGDSPDQGFRDDDDDDTRNDGIGTAPNQNGDNAEQPSNDETVSAPLKDDDGQLGTVVVHSKAGTPSVTVSQTPPASVTPPTVAVNGFEALSYLNVSGAQQVTVSVSKAKLNATGATADEVSLFRWQNGSWTAVETTVLNATDDAYRFRANATKGVFAVGVMRPATAVTDLTASNARIAPGDSVTFTVSVENTGLAEGTRTVELSVGGDVVATKNVTVPAGETVDVTFDRTFDEGGVYEVSVGDARAEVVVEGVQTGTTTDESGGQSSDDSATETTTPGSSSGIPGFGVSVAIIALVAAAMLALRRND